jgi:zinc protease
MSAFARLALLSSLTVAGIAPLAAQEPMPLDSAVTIGRLPNGLRYYIRENHYPEHRAELRLVVNAGSVLEDPDQLGLAHLVEHMAFNGTRHFPKQALVEYIERIGMRFGADLNAETSFDHTEYQLTVPTDSAGMLEQGVQILEDWAHEVTFDTTEIRKERGVVIEEWRLGRGADGRLFDRTFPVRFRGSRYAERLPIGTLASLQHASPAALTRFYHDWYRPDLMAVVAVGDFHKADVERLIRDRLGVIPRAVHPRPRPVMRVPPRTTEAVAIATDPEATRTVVNLQVMRPARHDTTVAGYREDLLASLYSRMLNARLDELAERPDPPFLGAWAGTSEPLRPVETFTLQAAVRDSLVLRGFGAVLTEIERVERHGFLASEFERTKAELVQSFENAYAERDHQESAGLAEACAAHFLDGEPMPGIAAERAMVTRLLPGISLGQVDSASRGWGKLRDRVITLTAPAAARAVLPTRAQLLATEARARTAPVEPYREALADAPLVSDSLPEAAIVREAYDSSHGVTRWTLANGVRLILKPTDFKADEIVLSAYSPGGVSRLPDSLRTASAFAGAALRTGGLGAFSAIDLQKKLAGRLVSVGPYIGPYQQGISGSTTRRDLSTLFQLVYLLFTAPRVDSAAFDVMHANARLQLARRAASPMAAFQDTLAVTLAQHHPWSDPMTPARSDSVRIGQVYAAYRDRFADAGDFTFVLVGSFDLDSLRPLVRRYLGNLPALHRDDSPRDPGIAPPPGVVEREVRQGIAPQSQTAVVFSGSLPWEPEERWAIQGVAYVLDVRLRESLREELGGTYGARVTPELNRVPKPEYRIRISFGSDPKRANELTRSLLTTVGDLRTRGPTPEEVANWKETVTRRQEVALRDNGEWASLLEAADASGEDLGTRLDLPRWLTPLTPERLRQAAERYLDPGHYVRATLLPADSASARAAGRAP